MSSTPVSRRPTGAGSSTTVVPISGCSILEPTPPPRSTVELPSSRPQRQRRFHSPGRFVESIDLHPQGHSLAVTVRGGAYTMPLWEGAPTRHGPVSSARQRLTSWLSDGQRIVTVTDEAGEEALALRRADGGEVARRQKVKLIQGDLGRVRTVDPAPGGGRPGGRHQSSARSPAGGRRPRDHQTRSTESTHSWIAGTAWSPDGNWLAFAAAVSRTTTNLFLHDIRTGETHQIGRPDFDDWAPSFDPEGRYLAFLSARVFDPVPDLHFHDYGFPRAALPMLIPLKADARSPFSVIARDPRPPGPPAPPGSAPPAPGAAGEHLGSNLPANGDTSQPRTEIDLEGIADRIQAFPVPPPPTPGSRPGRGRTYFQSQPVVGVLGVQGVGRADGPSRKLGLRHRQGRGRRRRDLRVHRLGGRQGAGHSNQGRAAGGPGGLEGRQEPQRQAGSGDRVSSTSPVSGSRSTRPPSGARCSTRPGACNETTTGGKTWEGSTGSGSGSGISNWSTGSRSRAEFSDLLWEMQGELGTSHAYELGGDYRPPPVWTQGHLGADVEWNRGAWRVTAIPAGDVWDQTGRVTAGGAREPAWRWAIASWRSTAGKRARSVSPQALLVERAGQAVTLSVASGRKAARRVTVAPLADEYALRYRDWVENNRAVVAERTGGQAGYIHIPDMGPPGFAEFHRYWKSSVDMPGLW